MFLKVYTVLQASNAISLKWLHRKWDEASKWIRINVEIRLSSTSSEASPFRLITEFAQISVKPKLTNANIPDPFGRTTSPARSDLHVVKAYYSRKFYTYRQSLFDTHVTRGLRRMNFTIPLWVFALLNAYPNSTTSPNICATFFTGSLLSSESHVG